MSKTYLKLIAIVSLVSVTLTACTNVIRRIEGSHKPSQRVLEVEHSIRVTQSDFQRALTEANSDSSDSHKRDEVMSKYAKLVSIKIPANTSAQDLARLACWSLDHDKWLTSSNEIYSMVFSECLRRLIAAHTDDSRRRIVEIKDHLQTLDAYDGHISECIDEALGEPNN